MSNLNTSVAAETQVPDKHGTPVTVTEPITSKKKCLVLSLIRHAQCESNCSETVADCDPLTDYGREQAQRLGNDWKDVRIDALHASTLQRAHHTAIEIAERNHDAELKTTTDEIYTEMQTCHDFYRMLDDRNYQPDGGESLEQVSSRAKQSLVTLLTQYGKELDEPPQEFLDKKQIDSPNILPEGIPHVVVVSHNGFLAEFYHSMCLWNNTHRMSLSCRYENAAWSRHIIWYDEKTKYLEYSNMRIPRNWYY